MILLEVGNICVFPSLFQAPIPALVSSVSDSGILSQRCPLQIFHGVVCSDPTAQLWTPGHSLSLFANSPKSWVSRLRMYHTNNLEDTVASESENAVAEISAKVFQQIWLTKSLQGTRLCWLKSAWPFDITWKATEAGRLLLHLSPEPAAQQPDHLVTSSCVHSDVAISCVHVMPGCRKTHGRNCNEQHHLLRWDNPTLQENYFCIWFSIFGIYVPYSVVCPWTGMGVKQCHLNVNL